VSELLTISSNDNSWRHVTYLRTCAPLAAVGSADELPMTQGSCLAALRQQRQAASADAAGFDHDDTVRFQIAVDSRQIRQQKGSLLLGPSLGSAAKQHYRRTTLSPHR
jgi:hypothetical protein